MNLKNIISVSGLPGLHKLVATRNNGLVVADLEKGKTQFCSVRKHQFTPLETVAIYTIMDTVELEKIFSKMMDEKANGNILPDPKSPNPELMSYFKTILPEYDDERVFPGDVKKIIKWYNQLDSHGFLDASKDEEE
jgi:hypothetical protein